MTSRTEKAAAALVLALFVFTGCQTLQGRSAGRYIDDSAITAQVKTRLAAAEAKTFTRVDVDTVKGVVYLNGVVESPEMKTHAEQIARSEEGVQRVVNNLQLERSPAAAPGGQPRTR